MQDVKAAQLNSIANEKVMGDCLVICKSDDLHTDCMRRCARLQQPVLSDTITLACALQHFRGCRPAHAGLHAFVDTAGTHN